MSKRKPVVPVAISASAKLHNAMIPIVDSIAKQSADSSALTSTRQAETFALIAGVWTECAGDVALFVTTCHAVFGNGSQSKKTVADGGDKIPGTLADHLKANKVPVGAVWKFLSNCRDVVNGMHLQTVREAKTFHAAQKVANPPKARGAKTPNGNATTPSGANTIDVATLAKAWIATHMDECIDELRALAIRAKDSIMVGQLASIEIHLNGKTQKTA